MEPTIRKLVIGDSSKVFTYQVGSHSEYYHPKKKKVVTFIVDSIEKVDELFGNPRYNIYIIDDGGEGERKLWKQLRHTSNSPLISIEYNIAD